MTEKKTSAKLEGLMETSVDQSNDSPSTNSPVRITADPPKRRWALITSVILFVFWIGFLAYVAFQVAFGN